MLKSQFSKHYVEAGCDEAGRGCLAGPVVAAAVIFPKGYRNRDLNDSKQLSREARAELQAVIHRDAIAYAVGVVHHDLIDKINILNASYEAMHLAVKQLTVRPELLLIDGNRFKPFPGIEHKCIVKGDAKFLSIAAASILAKTYRDGWMWERAREFPGYGWETNVGYPTVEHRDAIRAQGLTPIHRRSFRQLPEQLELFED
ncbi:MAG: ribonuclease HII [Cyclobacteriaceae bacterium]|nr:ribonuclease HII [Cyclobacteriaceae bacterium]